MEHPIEDHSVKPVQGRGAYLLPNILTTAALFAGFYSVIAAMNGLFDVAAIAVFIAMIADTLDGRVARYTGTQSAFGAEYDSLSDMVAFGIAPALVVYTWALVHLGKVGWLAAFLYVAGTALRLARFNIQTEEADKRFFQGIPCPAAAGFITSSIWLATSYRIPITFEFTILLAVITVGIAALMVSNIRYYSFKQMEFKGIMPFFVGVLPVLAIVGIAISPCEVIFGMLAVYVTSGPLVTLWTQRRRKTHN